MKILVIILAFLATFLFLAVIMTPIMAVLGLLNNEFKTKEEFYNNLFIWRLIKSKINNLI